jgi:hypothetical protein
MLTTTLPGHVWKMRNLESEDATPMEITACRGARKIEKKKELILPRLGFEPKISSQL